jgi:hypothetical protein
MQFEEQLLTNNKGAQNHYRTEQVRIIRLWGGNTPSIKPLLTQYCIWLQDAIIMDIHRRRKAEQKSRNIVNNSKEIRRG